MAHFAELDQNNEVKTVIVIGNDIITDENGNEVEQLGIDYIRDELKKPNRWIQTSYNNSSRVRYATPGGSYNETLDAFIPRKPYESWTLDSSTADWVAPTPKPDTKNVYEWNEYSLTWNLILEIEESSEE